MVPDKLLNSKQSTLNAQVPPPDRKLPQIDTVERWGVGDWELILPLPARSWQAAEQCGLIDNGKR